MPPYANESREFGGRRQLMVAAGFLILSVLTAALPSGAQQWVAAGLRATILRPFIVTQAAVTSARIRATEAERLRARADSLLAVVTTLAPIAEENQRLRELAGLGERLGDGYVAADVVRPGTGGSESMFLISLGARQGVRVNTPVLDHRGLVGVIREVAPSTAMGMDWTHPDFRAAAMAEGGQAFGLVEPSRGAFREADRLILSGTSYSVELPEGTRILTSGLGATYPRGIPIGRVAGVESEEAGWRRSYWVEPVVNPASVIHVLLRVGGAPSVPFDSVESEVIAPDLEAVWSPPPSDADSTGTQPGPPTDGGEQ
jgi:rod shape-determining protein MreC